MHAHRCTQVGWNIAFMAFAMVIGMTLLLIPFMMYGLNLQEDVSM